MKELREIGNSPTLRAAARPLPDDERRKIACLTMSASSVISAATREHLYNRDAAAHIWTHHLKAAWLALRPADLAWDKIVYALEHLQSSVDIATAAKFD